MAWQHWRVIDPETTHSSDDTTYRIKLPQSNVLHTLLVKCVMTNGATSNQGNGMADAVDWIKVVANGSQVLTYLEPEHLRLFNLYNTGSNIEEVHDEQGSATQEAVYVVQFGRNWFDQKFYLPLARFNDVELQIKYSPTIAATGFATGTFTTTVLGLMTLEGDPGPYEGTLVSRIIENFTTVASGDKVVKPPQRWPWRSLLVRCYEAGIADGTDIDNVEFSLNNGQRTPLDLSWDELHNLNQSLRPVFTRRNGVLYRADTDTVNVLVSRIRQVEVSAESAEKSVQVTGIAGDQLTLKVNDQSTQDVDEGGSGTYTIHDDETSDQVIRYSVMGEGLPFAIFVPLNVYDEPPYFDSNAWDEVELTLTQNAAGGDVDVLLQEVQRF